MKSCNEATQGKHSPIVNMHSWFVIFKHIWWLGDDYIIYKQFRQIQCQENSQTTTEQTNRGSKDKITIFFLIQVCESIGKKPLINPMGLCTPVMFIANYFPAIDEILHHLWHNAFQPLTTFFGNPCSHCYSHHLKEYRISGSKHR